MAEVGTFGNPRKISRAEWDAIPRDYAGTTTTLHCRYCGAWGFKSRPDLILDACTAQSHEWEERRTKTRLTLDGRGVTVLEIVEVDES